MAKQFAFALMGILAAACQGSQSQDTTDQPTTGGSGGDTVAPVGTGGTGGAPLLGGRGGASSSGGTGGVAGSAAANTGGKGGIGGNGGVATDAGLPVDSAAATGSPIKVLYLTGGGFHDYQAMKTLLTEKIGELANVAFTSKFLEEPSQFLDPNLAKGFDAVIFNMCHADGDYDSIAQNLKRIVEAGMPSVVVHCAMHSFRGTETWASAIGMRTVAHEDYGNVSLTKGDDHPITKTWPANFTTNDELYITVKLFPNTTTLIKGKSNTVAWIHNTGKGSVFGTTMGHDFQTLNRGEYQRLLAAGLLFVTGHLGSDGFPTAGYVGKKQWN